MHAHPDHGRPNSPRIGCANDLPRSPVCAGTYANRRSPRQDADKRVPNVRRPPAWKSAGELPARLRRSLPSQQHRQLVRDSAFRHPPSRSAFVPHCPLLSAVGNTGSVPLQQALWLPAASSRTLNPPADTRTGCDMAADWVLLAVGCAVVLLVVGVQPSAAGKMIALYVGGSAIHCLAAVPPAACLGIDTVIQLPRDLSVQHPLTVVILTSTLCTTMNL
jgi:hypothetical protein